MNENEWNSAVNSYQSSMAGLTQTIQNLNQLESNKRSAEEQRDWSERMLDKQNEWSLNMWNKTNEYNKPSAQLQRLKEAGLNPLYFGLDGSSAQAFQSAQPLAYERASVANMPNPLDVASGVGLVSAQARSAAKDIELKNAQIDKLNADASGTKLDNQFKDMTLQARAEGVELANQATKEQIHEVKSQIAINEQELKKRIEETKNEIEKRGLIVAEAMLSKANAGKAEAESKSILELLPLQKLLTKAQTEAQKASAAASYASAAINKGLLDAGYIDKQIDSLVAEIGQKEAVAKSAEAQKAINEWKLAVRNGNAFENHYDNPSVGKFMGDFFNAFYQMVSTTSEAVGGGLSGFVK